VLRWILGIASSSTVSSPGRRRGPLHFLDALFSAQFGFIRRWAALASLAAVVFRIFSFA